MVREVNDEQRGILKYLDTRNNPLTKENIKAYLDKQGYNPSIKKVTDDINHLIKLGYIATETERAGEDITERFYVTRGIGGGRRAQRRVQGRGAGHYIGGLLKRILGSIFLLFGLGFLFYQDIITTGNVISESAAAFDIAFILSLVLMILGGILFHQSFKR